MTVRIRPGAATDVGRVRQVNQDAYLVLEERRLYAVADGMGGHRGGEVASQMALEALRQAYLAPGADALGDAIAEANGRIFDTGSADPNLQGMGTTVVAAALVEADGDGHEQLLIANVGDSRAYLFRDGGLTQLTEDHSMVADLLREGRITEEEAESHPQRNIVTRVLGPYDQVEIDFWPVDPVVGDRVLLCSDGLVNEVATDQITSVLRRLGEPQDAASELVRLANDGGGRDNITVVLLDVVDDGGVATAASAALADEPRRVGGSRGDLAGFDDAVAHEPGTAVLPAQDAEAPVRRRLGLPRRRKERAERERVSLRDRLTWRTVLFLVGLVVVIGGAFATIQWYGTSTYYVGFRGNAVTIFKGRPGGVLWVDPTVKDTTDIERTDVPQRYLNDLEDGREEPSLAKAKRYVGNIQRDIDATTTTTSTTTTLPVGTPSTAPPVAPAN